MRFAGAGEGNEATLWTPKLLLRRSARTMSIMPIVWSLCFVSEEGSLLRGASSVGGVRDVDGDAWSAAGDAGRGGAVSWESAGEDEVDCSEWK
jgi:hypothetical protein